MTSRSRSFLLGSLLLASLVRAAEPTPPSSPLPAKKELLQFAPGRQMIWRPSPPMLNQVPGVVYPQEPSQPIISQKKDFSDTAKLLEDRYATWGGLPAVAVAPNGRLWIAYTTGGHGEHDHYTKNQVVLYTAASLEAPLEGPVVLSKSDYGYYCFQPSLWIDPKGRLWFSYTEVGLGEEGLAGVSLVTGNPGDSHPAWEKPRLIVPGHWMNKPTVLKNGDWIYPAEDYRDPKVHYNRLYVSRDQGKSFSFYTSLRVDGMVWGELMTAQKNDGSLWMLTRTTTNSIVESTSRDEGKTWQDIRPLSESGIQSPVSRFHVTRLKSGRLLLVYNNHPKSRTNMTAALSDDDGKTWPYKLLLDDGEHVTYPDAHQAPDGSIAIAYDRNRYKIAPFTHKELPLTQWGEIMLARVTEEDILAGKVVSPKSFTGKVLLKKDSYAAPSQLRFDFDGILDGWEPNDQCELDPEGEAGALTFFYHGSGPNLTSRAINLVGGPGPLVVSLRLKVSHPGDIRVYYQQTDDKGQNATQFISIPVPTEAVEKWTEVRGELPVKAVKLLKLTPNGKNGKISIDWIEIGSR